MRVRIGLMTVGLATLFFSACDTQTKVHDPRVVLSDGSSSVVVHVEIADTEIARAKGLMDRAELASDHGMLFVMDREEILNFWMKHTLIPLDILFFDHNRVMISSASMVPCESDPCRLYGSISPALYALEVPSGFLQKQGVKNGWILTLPTP